MAIVDNNPIMKGVRGMLGGTVVYREVKGKLIMANSPLRSNRFVKSFYVIGND